MPKAILEFPEMPESCGNCPCCRKMKDYCFCEVLLNWYVGEGRRADCPLKLADEHCRKAEWINGKCRGFQVSRWDDEPAEMCKNCKDFDLYEEVEP